MKITVAGVQKEVADGLTVAQLIVDENVETPQYVTVTINDVTWHLPTNRSSVTPATSF